MQLTLKAGASVAEIARAHGVNANQVFKWRRAFDRCELSEPCAALIPVPGGWWPIRKLYRSKHFGVIFRIGTGKRPRIPRSTLTYRRYLGHAVSILRQSRRLYGCWPLRGAFSQPSEAKARTKAKASYCCLHCRSTGDSRENILPEFSKFYCHPGGAGGSPLWISRDGGPV